MSKGKDIWYYENFLSDLRDTNKSKSTMNIMDFIGVIVSTVIIICTVVYRFNIWIEWDWLGLGLSLLLIVPLFMKSKQIVDLRKRNFKIKNEQELS